MSIPYIPLYVADFEADTAHLTLEEDGAYNRLLRLCWRTPGCSVPDDPKWIMRKMRVSADDYYRVVEPLIEEFFTKGMNRIFNARLQREHARIEETSKKRSDAGRKGGRPAKSLKTNNTDKSPAKAKQKQPEPEPEPEPDIREPKGSLSSGDDAPQPIDQISEAVSAYNAAAKEQGWPSVQTVNPRRRAALKARLRECDGLEGWAFALSKARASPLCNGENDRGWVLDFDFLLQQKSFTKLMEGSYDARTPRRTQSSPQPGNSQGGASLASIAARRALERQVRR